MRIAKQVSVIALLYLLIWGIGGFIPRQNVVAQESTPEVTSEVTPSVSPEATSEVTPEITATVESSSTPTLLAETPQLTETPTEVIDASLANELAAPSSQMDTSQWPQVQNDPEHTGYTPQSLGANFSVVWRKAFQPEKVFPQVQAIIQSNRVFVPTESGNVYALNATTGAQLWVFHADGPILNSVAAGDNRVYFGAMDGSVYAVNAATGALLWKNQLSWRVGFSTAPLLADGRVMLGGRNGVFYALNPTNGDVEWEYKSSGPILMTAAWHAGQVYFTSMDMHVYALASGNGAVKWVSEKVPALAFKDYFPLVYGGYVYVRPWNKGELGVEDRNLVTDASTQLAVLNAYSANPNKPITLYRFRETDGSLGAPIIHYWYQTMNGAVAPPCVDAYGMLVMSAPMPFDATKEGWGRVNPNTRVMVDLLLENGKPDAGTGAGDETMALTCTANLILAMHFEEQNVQYTGAFNLTNRTWTHIGLGKRNQEMFTNTQGGGTNAASVANGLVYHISVYELIVRSTN